MARYIGPKCRLCRREGMQLFLKGERCHTVKCAIARRGDNYPPGGRMMKRGRGGSDYGSQLREKQRLKRLFGMLERQFRLAFARAQRSRGNTGATLLQVAERRLDNIVRISGFGHGPASARQIVAHGWVLVNNRKVDRPSYMVRAGDVVTFTTRENARKVLSEILQSSKAYQQVPSWLERNEEAMTVKVQQLPTREEFPFKIQEQLIVEGASK